MEIDFQGIVTDALTIEGGVGFVDAKYTRLAPPGPRFVNTIPVDGKLINTPKWSANLGVDYVFPLEFGGDITFHVDYSHKDTIANDGPNTPELVQGPVHIANMSMTYTSASGFWSVIAGGTNITDERYVYSGLNIPGLGIVDGVFSRPAEWYVTFRLNSQ